MRFVLSTAGTPITPRASAKSAGVPTRPKAAVGTPASRMNAFSASRSWAIARARGPGWQGTAAASVSTVASGTFSNSSVTTSTAPAKVAKAAVSS